MTLHNLTAAQVRPKKLVPPLWNRAVPHTLTGNPD
jgi:hypothetical protein